MSTKVPQDKNGNTVCVGTTVKLLHHIKGAWFNHLPEDEKGELDSMVGENFIIEEITEQGKVELTKWWHSEDEDSTHSMCHSIVVEDEQIEIVR